ncbi:MAG: homoserine O-succinyltransferase [Microbacteriaceae bacterium]|jgi:homoserine O-succinyltransferase|nr:homoserine O-succinyltransferase [Microbacteriaceae bacterium]
MPITVPDGLPAAAILRRENIFAIPEFRARSQDIRPLHILILNLMPTKVATETQLLRLLGNSPLQVDVELLQTATYTPTHVSAEYLLRFYETFDEVRERRFDGLIITGAPVERLPFEEVDYWPELVDILEWSRENVWSTLHICWGAQAGLYHRYGVPKIPLAEKLVGVFEHTVEDRSDPLFRGFDDRFRVPHSRYTTVSREAVEAVPGLRILSTSPEAGVYAAATADGREVYLTGHAEYDRQTLADEYARDVRSGLTPALPRHYFPGDDPARSPRLTWRAASQLLMQNWLNYAVYQETPYEQVSGPVPGSSPQAA